MPEPITKTEALRRLAVEVMGWTPAEHYGYVIKQGNEFVPSYRPDWNPFTELNDAFELQARLSDKQWYEYCDLLISGPCTGLVSSMETHRACANATADQRTRAIAKVVLGVEVEA